MNYLMPAEYAEFGLPPDIADAWVTAASAMIDAHCRRASLGAVSYAERTRLSNRSGRSAQTVCVSYTPLVSVDVVRVQYARDTGGECLTADAAFVAQIASAFSLAGQWITLDPATVDVDVATGVVTLPAGTLAPRYGTVELTYTAGFQAVPASLKVACAQIVKNAQATPGLNVRSSRMDTLQTAYFSDSLLDSQVKALLRPYVAERLS